jgi:hypothetical protein
MVPTSMSANGASEVHLAMALYGQLASAKMLLNWPLQLAKFTADLRAGSRREAKPMEPHEKSLYKKLIDIALQDPFVQLIAGLIVVAFVASSAVAALGSGPKAIIGLALTVTGGLVLFVIRTVVVKYPDSPFVKIVAFISASVIIGVFLIFVLLLVPAATICWPEPYREMLSLPACAVSREITPKNDATPKNGDIFELPDSTRLPSVLYNPENSNYTVLIFYRSPRIRDAENIVGTLLKAGYKSNASESDLNEVRADDKRPGSSLIKSTAMARPIVDDVHRIVKLAIPLKADFIKDSPDELRAIRDVQVILF